MVAIIIASLLLTSITSLISCKVAIVIYSCMLTIILPLSCLMLYLESNIENSEIRAAFGICSKLAILGFIFIVASGFLANENDVIINNYIPILNNLIFIGGISIFLGSSLLASLLAGSNIVRLIYGIAASSLIISYRKIYYEITYPIDLHGYFEMLFLGPASIISILSIFLVYLILQKMLCAETSIFAEYSAIAAAIIILKHHFLSEVDSAKFFSISGVHIHMIKALLVFFILISVIRYLKNCKLLPLLVLISMIIFSSFDFYNADQGETIEYFRLTHNYGITISIMCYLAYILVDHESYLMKYAKSMIIIYALSSMMVIFNTYYDWSMLFTSISGILFAIICIINIILERRKLEKK